jgi:ATP-dependent exoDNAse (exonuclease V) beta subunit
MATSHARQLSLFPQEKDSPVPSPDSQKQITWSHSRRSTLEKCAYLYYLQYFGANKNTAKQERDKSTFHFLKRLRNRHLRIGKILHLMIATYLRKLQEGDEWEVQRLASWAQDIFQKDIVYSRENPDGDNRSKERFPPTLLREYHYRLPNADELCREAEEKLVYAVTSFVTDGIYDEFRFAGSRRSSLIEEKFSLSGKLYRITGQIDLAYQQDGTVSLVDWKLGGDDGTGDDSLQLAAYALWAIQHFNCTPEALRVYKVHLSTGEIVSFNADANVIASARARIEQDAERMMVLQRYGEQAIAEAFTRCLEPAICRQCVFERVCYA